MARIIQELKSLVPSIEWDSDMHSRSPWNALLLGTGNAQGASVPVPFHETSCARELLPQVETGHLADKATRGKRHVAQLQAKS